MFFIPCGIIGCSEVMESPDLTLFGMCTRHTDEALAKMWDDVPIISFTEVVEEDGTITMYPAI